MPLLTGPSSLYSGHCHGGQNDCSNGIVSRICDRVLFCPCSSTPLASSCNIILVNQASALAPGAQLGTLNVSISEEPTLLRCADDASTKGFGSNVILADEGSWTSECRERATLIAASDGTFAVCRIESLCSELDQAPSRRVPHLDTSLHHRPRRCCSNKSIGRCGKDGGQGRD